MDDDDYQSSTQHTETPAMVPIPFDLTQKRGLEVPAVRDAVRSINRRHTKAFRKHETNDPDLGAAGLVLKRATNAEINVLTEVAPTSLFCISRNTNQHNPQSQWWADDDILDHLLWARDVARWSNRGASMLTGIGPGMLRSIADLGVPAIRNIARTSRVCMCWSSRELNRAMHLVGNGDSDANRLNANIWMAGVALSITANSHRAYAI